MKNPNNPCLFFHCSCCTSDPCNDLCLSASDILVSQGEIVAHRVPSKFLCLGIAQSYRDKKLHITTTQPTLGFGPVKPTP